MHDIISTEEIYNDILTKIISLEFIPGSMISENKICEEYNVSRSVIRNVFARLAQIDLINVYPQRGTYVNKIDLEYLKTALIIRVAIEKEMLYRFMKLEDKSEVIKKMEANISKQEKFRDEKIYVEDFKKLDEEFHKYIILGAENNNILSMIDVYLLHISRWRNIYVASGRKLSQLIDEHKNIFNAIKENNLLKALSCMSVHIHTVEGMVGFVEEHAAYFK